MNDPTPGRTDSLKTGSAGVPPAVVGVSPTTSDTPSIPDVSATPGARLSVGEGAGWLRPRRARSPFPTGSFPLSHAGRWMLNRRDFFRLGGTGLSAVALATLLAKQRLLAQTRDPWRPDWLPERPHAPRPPHFTPK